MKHKVQYNAKKSYYLNEVYDFNKSAGVIGNGC